MYEILKNSNFIIAADGGANLIYKLINEFNIKDLRVDYIIGDLDSLRDNVRLFFET